MLVRVSVAAQLLALVIACGAPSAEQPPAAAGETCGVAGCVDGFECSAWVSKFFYAEKDSRCESASCLAFVSVGRDAPCDVPHTVGPDFVVRNCSEGLFCDGQHCQPVFPVGAPCKLNECSANIRVKDLCDDCIDELICAHPGGPSALNANWCDGQVCRDD